MRLQLSGSGTYILIENPEWFKASYLEGRHALLGGRLREVIAARAGAVLPRRKRLAAPDLGDCGLHAAPLLRRLGGCGWHLAATTSGSSDVAPTYLAAEDTADEDYFTRLVSRTVVLIDFASISLPVKVHLKKKSGGRFFRWGYNTESTAGSSSIAEFHITCTGTEVPILPLAVCIKSAPEEKIRRSKNLTVIDRESNSLSITSSCELFKILTFWAWLG
jgi:hypothetical protein